MIFRYYQTAKTYYCLDTRTIFNQKEVLAYFQEHPNENIHIVDADTDEDLTAFFLLKILIYFERETRQLNPAEIRAIVDRCRAWDKFE